MTIDTPAYIKNKPTALKYERDTARWRSALLTAVRSRRSGLAVRTPEGYYTVLRPLTAGAAKYAWGARARTFADTKIESAAFDCE